MRARMALRYAMRKHELREVVLKDKPPQLLAVSPKATVPVLLVDGKVLEESLDIMQWALTQHDPDHWLAVTCEPTLLSHPLIQRNDREFKPLLDRYKYHDRHPEVTQDDTLQQMWPFLQHLETLIEQHHGFLGRDSFSVLDAAIFPFIRQFAHSDTARFNELALPNVRAWLDVCLTSPLFEDVMPKYQAWSEDKDNAVIIG